MKLDWKLFVTFVNMLVDCVLQQQVGRERERERKRERERGGEVRREICQLYDIYIEFVALFVCLFPSYNNLQYLFKG